MTLTAFPPPDPDTVAARSAARHPDEPTLPPRGAPAHVGPGPSLPRSSGPTPKNQPTGKSRRVATMVLVIAGLAAVMVLLAVAVLPVLQDDNETEPVGGVPTTSPSQSLELRPLPSVAETPDPAPAAETPAPVPESPIAEPVVEGQPIPTVAPAPDAAGVPESKAVVRGG
jgi:hypothetical protein